MDQKRKSELSIVLGVTREFVLLLRDWFTGLFLVGHLILGAACEMLPHNNRAATATPLVDSSKHGSCSPRSIILAYMILLAYRSFSSRCKYQL